MRPFPSRGQSVNRQHERLLPRVLRQHRGGPQTRGSLRHGAASGILLADTRQLLPRRKAVVETRRRLSPWCQIVAETKPLRAVHQHSQHRRYGNGDHRSTSQAHGIPSASSPGRGRKEQTHSSHGEG